MLKIIYPLVEYFAVLPRYSIEALQPARRGLGDAVLRGPGGRGAAPLTQSELIAPSPPKVQPLVADPHALHEEARRKASAPTLHCRASWAGVAHLCLTPVSPPCS